MAASNKQASLLHYDKCQFYSISLIVTLCQCHIALLSNCEIVTLRYCHTVALSHFITVTVWHCHTALL